MYQRDSLVIVKGMAMSMEDLGWKDNILVTFPIARYCAAVYQTCSQKETIGKTKKILS